MGMTMLVISDLRVGRRFGGNLPPHPVVLETPGCDWVRARAARCGERVCP